MAGDCTIFDEPHHQSLELLAAQALAEGNSAAAFRFADRRCRILPQPEPHCYILRSEASFKMRAKSAAIADLERALEIAPDNIAANRRMLAWADGPRQLQAAFSLITQDHAIDSMHRAIRILYAAGQRNLACVTVLEDAIEGWAVWHDEADLELSISDGAHNVSVMFGPDPLHPFIVYGHATSFRVHRPKSANAQSITLSTAGGVFHSTRAAANGIEAKMRIHWPRSENARNRQVTVIVPVYTDYDATRLCLEALLNQLNSSCHRAILVNDASPDPRIAKYVAMHRTETCVDVLVNSSNLGFAGSVNRAIAQVKQDDIIILNSDTVVPPGFIERLTAAAQSSSDIGTVTPLSNNGEFTSFPIPNIANPLCSREDVERLDNIAAKVNSNRVVDIPSGIGFCLYVTRECLECVGPLSDDFSTGYLEDADFCLRARAHGFRNVCAPSVYVGHAGSKSFGQKKRSLVARNLSVFERRFPKHRSECAAFMAADPLRSAREAIERVAAAIASHPRLLLTGGGAIGAIARERAREVSSEPLMILEVRTFADGAKVKIINASGGIPQSLQFNLVSSSEIALVIDFVRSLQPSRIEILDPTNAPLQFVDALLNLNIPYDIFIADAALRGRDNAHCTAAATLRAGTNEQNISERREVLSEIDTGPKRQNWLRRWQQIADGAQRILVPCTQAEAFAASVLSRRAMEKIASTGTQPGRTKRRARKVAVGHIGFVPVRSCVHEQSLMSEIAHGLSRLRPDVSITVIGAALDDKALMRSCNVFVTGAINTDEFDYVVDALGLGVLFVSTTQPLFGHPILSVAFSSPRPKAYFDWSAGRIKPKKNDLSLNPQLPLDDIINKLVRWIPEP